MFERPTMLRALALVLLVTVAGAGTAAPTSGPETANAEPKAPPTGFKPDEVRSSSTVTIGGRRLDYDAIAGTLVVHPKGWDDVPQNADPDDKALPAQASMFYVAYFKKAEPGARRPVTFIYNGGPGSSTVWLHMGAFGPRRVVTADHDHTRPAPYSTVNNDSSLLDVSDLVFIDAPGAGFSRVAGKDRDKAFFGIDQDAHAFAEFISQFLGKYGRWNSPKYLLGESYGTTRSAAVAGLLETQRSISLNGVILISQALDYVALPDFPLTNPGEDLGFEIALPTYAASAWFHHKLGDARPLEAVVKDAEQYAMGDYASALLAGNTLGTEQRHAVAARLHALTGLSVDYIERSNLRVGPGSFEQELLREDGSTLGRLDTRFKGPALDALAKDAQYDPQSAAISAAYVSAFNAYARQELKYGEGREFKVFADVEKTWNWRHQAQGDWGAMAVAPNVLPDLAAAMKYNPNLRVMLNAGYYDLATPYFEGVYEMRHLPVPPNLQDHVETDLYEAGHMLYAKESVLHALHDKVADFIGRTRG